MARKRFLGWVGYKGDESTSVRVVESSKSPSNEREASLSNLPSNSLSNSQSNVARIRELENQLAELKARRDITSLTKEEFEVLASETAMSLIKTAQAREAKATTTAQRAIAESTAAARDLIASAESKAKSLLASAESRGRKYIQAAEADAKDLLAEATSESESMVAAAEKEADYLAAAKKREASALLSGAKKEAEQLVSGAVGDIANYRSWLTSAISEAERLNRIQQQSLNAAEQAIEQTRNRLTQAFDRLASLQTEIDANLNADNTPKHKTYSKSGVDSGDELAARRAKKSAKKVSSNAKSAKSAKKSGARSKKTTKKSSARR
jgi:hypothetical protein